MIAVVLGFSSASNTDVKVVCLYAGTSKQAAGDWLKAGGEGIVRAELFVNPMHHQRRMFKRADMPVIEVPAEGDELGKKEDGAGDLVSALADIALKKAEIDRLNIVLAGKDKKIEKLKGTLADVGRLANDRSGTIASQERELISLRAEVTALEAAVETKTFLGGDKPSTEASGEAGRPGGTPASLEPEASVAGVSTDASAPSGGNLPLGLPDKAGKKK